MTSGDTVFLIRNLTISIVFFHVERGEKEAEIRRASAGHQDLVTWIVPRADVFPTPDEAREELRRRVTQRAIKLREQLDRLRDFDAATVALKDRRRGK